MSSPWRGAFPIVLLGLATTAGAQDSNYWTLQYGPVAELLGGQVVGSTRDLSATFYNPGALALAKNPTLLASVESFQATRVKATAEAPALDFQDFTLQPAPSLFTFALPRDWTGKHTLAISALTRQDFDVRIDEWPASPSPRAGSEALLDQSLTENWFGLSWAHPLGESYGIGLTTYVAYRGQRARRELSGEAALPSGQGAAVLRIQDFDYSNYRLLWKAGIATQRDSWDLGLTVTTSSVRLLGSGSASYATSSVGGGQGATVSVRHLEDLESTYESPWSVAAGGAYRRGQNTFHGSVEWFNSVPSFEVLDTSPFLSDPNAEGLVQRLQQQAKSVVNFGVGYERRVNGRFSYYGAFTTDFSYADKSSSRGSALSTWDIYHVTAGTSLIVGSLKLTMGAAYAFGSDPRSLSVLVAPPGGLPEERQTTLDVKFSRFNMLVGFDFGH